MPGNAISSDTVFMACGPLVCSFTGTKSLNHGPWANRVIATDFLLKRGCEPLEAGHNLMLPPPKRLFSDVQRFRVTPTSETVGISASRIAVRAAAHRGR